MQEKRPDHQKIPNLKIFASKACRALMHDCFDVSPETFAKDLFKGFPPFLSGKIVFNELGFGFDISATVLVGHSTNASTKIHVDAEMFSEKDYKNMWILGLTSFPAGERLPNSPKRRKGAVGPTALMFLKNLRNMTYLQLEGIYFRPEEDGERLWKKRRFKSTVFSDGEEKILIGCNKVRE